LHTVLRNGGVEGPYVLVGLSMGAVVARLYASEYPAEAAGMIIVDHAFLDTSATSGDMKPAAASGADSPPVLIHQEPIIWTIEDDPNFGKLPERARELHRWAVSLHPALPTVKVAKECLAAVEEVTPQSDHPLGGMPLVVISTVHHPPSYGKLQGELLALSGNSKQLVAEKSFHAVTIDQPEAIVTAIREVVEAVRGHSTLAAHGAGN
jgi:pimeloyl-ACP methyl ester carboxylesterase